MESLRKKVELERDEELSFFRELRKRQNEHFPSLLLSASSEDYERDPNGGSGKFSLYKIPSGRKEFGLEFLETNKSEFDWLKTPPATPLFPSLEMEPSAQLLTQKELPISQPFSKVQFPKSDRETPKPKAINRKENHTNSTKSNLSRRSITPSQNRQKPSTTKNTNEQQQASSNAKKDHDSSTNNKRTTNNVDFPTLNQKKNIEANISQRKPKPRRISPSMKSSIELSNETPSNLKTDKRSSSSTRGRSTTRASTTTLGFQNQDPIQKSCRPSRSPSPSMSNVGGNWNHKNLRTQKETFTLAAGNNESRSSYFKGSKMVEKVVNARKSSINQIDRETKAKPKYKVAQEK